MKFMSINLFYCPIYHSTTELLEFYHKVTMYLYSILLNSCNLLRETEKVPVQLCPFSSKKAYLIPNQSKAGLDDPRS